MNSVRQTRDAAPGGLLTPIYLNDNATTPHTLFARRGRHNLENTRAS